MKRGQRMGFAEKKHDCTSGVLGVGHIGVRGGNVLYHPRGNIIPHITVPRVIVVKQLADRVRYTTPREKAVEGSQSDPGIVFF